MLADVGDDQGLDIGHAATGPLISRAGITGGRHPAGSDYRVRSCRPSILVYMPATHRVRPAPGAGLVQDGLQIADQAHIHLDILINLRNIHVDVDLFGIGA